jgi:LAS superfamily LD-carboxypeptidase LdcB
MLNSLQLTGRAATHVQAVPALACTLHRDAVAAAIALRDAAATDGIDLTIVSSFRDFERQVGIWNSKYRGERPLLDRQERPIDPATLDERGRVDAILLWSALPGASRHHWGTDIDVIDKAAAPTGCGPKLTASEFSNVGPYALLNRWLDEHIGQFGFFRPYGADRGGVQPEPWHLSYAPVAVPALEALSLAMLVEAIAGSSMHGREQVLARLPELYTRFVTSVDQCPDQAFLI